jgi:hypothetical protein
VKIAARFRSLDPRARVALGLIALCMMLASGRMNSLDGSSALVQAVHFCVSGHVAASHPLTSEFSPQNVSSRSAFYDANDVGGTGLMLPAACVAALDGAPDPATLWALTSVAKVGASLTFSLVPATGVVFVLLALAELVGLRRATRWALAFLLATGFLAYLKATWDVLPAASAVAMLVWVTVRCRLGLDLPRRTLLLGGLAVGLAGLCRYSLAPFLIIGATAALWPAVRAATVKARVESALALVAVLLPNFVANQVRTGAFWKPGQDNPAFHNEPAVTVHYLLSTLGMFVRHPVRVAVLRPDLPAGLCRNRALHPPLSGNNARGLGERAPNGSRGCHRSLLFAPLGRVWLGAALSAATLPGSLRRCSARR